MLTEPALALSRILVHRGWRPGSADLRHDIALLQLKEPLPEGKFHPVLLADAPKAGRHVVAAGYGMTSEKGKHSTRAKQARLVSQEFEKCATREKANVQRFLRERLQTCATSLGFPHKGVTDTCCKYT